MKENVRKLREMRASVTFPEYKGGPITIKVQNTYFSGTQGLDALVEMAYEWYQPYSKFMRRHHD